MLKKGVVLMVNFSQAELDIISQLSVSGGWDHEDAVAVRSKIRSHLLGQPSLRCCYCQRTMEGWHGLSIDTEHILPKAKHPKHIFELRNLDVACKRCNMGIKRENDSFYVGEADSDDPFHSDLYTIIHPKLDDVFSHLDIIVFQRNNELLVHYSVVSGSSKGEATREFFRLRELEVDSIDRSQGIQLPPEVSKLPDKVVEEIDELEDPDGGI